MSILIIETENGPELQFYLRSHRRAETVRVVDGASADVNVFALSGDPIALLRHLRLHAEADYLAGRSDDWRWLTPHELAWADILDARRLIGDLK